MRLVQSVAISSAHTSDILHFLLEKSVCQWIFGRTSFW